MAEEEVETGEEIMTDRGLLIDTEMIGIEEDLHVVVGMTEMTTVDLLLIDVEDIMMMMAGEVMTIVVVVEVEDEVGDVEASEEVIMMMITEVTTTTTVTTLGEKIRRIDFQIILSTSSPKMIH